MYRKGQTWKVELKSGIFYTGEITSTSENSFFMQTIRGEEVFINASEIKRSLRLKELEQNRGKNGEANENV